MTCGEVLLGLFRELPRLLFEFARTLLAGLKQRKKSVCTESIQDFKTDARDT
jgi:hypothetical protein